MTTVGDLKAFLDGWHDGCEISVDMGPKPRVKGMELAYDVTTDSLVISIVPDRKSLFIGAKT